MEGKTCIFVLDRGFVLVGVAHIDPDIAFHWLLKPGRTIRTWGTSEGLAELCEGPVQGKTVLDKATVRRIPFRAIIEIMEASDTKWSKHLSM